MQIVGHDCFWQNNNIAPYSIVILTVAVEYEYSINVRIWMKTCWIGWVSDDKLIPFGWRSGSGYDKFLKLICHYGENHGAKNNVWNISLKVVDELWQNKVDELGRWQEQGNWILVQIQIQIRPISGIHFLNCSAWRRCVLYQVPYTAQNKIIHEKGFS